MVRVVAILVIDFDREHPGDSCDEGREIFVAPGKRNVFAANRDPSSRIWSRFQSGDVTAWNCSDC